MPDAGSVQDNRGRDVTRRQGLQVYCRERGAAASGDEGRAAEGVEGASEPTPLQKKRTMTIL